ncbi:MAG: Sua5/YciO/YrdC/YwlC family protein, partial [Armatimonadetes bacterium]|nr:Sua5/YciO/YrdC/YwlC family protein [Armatimonadota bacterium]
MRTIDEDTPARAARVLEGGGLVVMPTDTVYGLAAALDEPCALDRVFYAKRRPRDMPLPVLVASPRAAGRLAAEPLSGPALTLCERFWPGALTIIVRAAGSVPSQVTAGGETVG